MNPRHRPYLIAVTVALAIAGCSAADRTVNAGDGAPTTVVRHETVPNPIPDAEARYTDDAATVVGVRVSDGSDLDVGYAICDVIAANHPDPWPALATATYGVGFTADEVAGLVVAATTWLCPDEAYWISSSAAQDR